MNKYTAKKFIIPEIDGLPKESIDVHLGLYNGYVTNLNKQYEELDNLRNNNTENKTLESALIRRIGFELSGIKNHELYFDCLVGGATPIPEDSLLNTKINVQFGSHSSFVQRIRDVAMSMRGVGWVMVPYDKENDVLHIVWVCDHELGNVALPSVIAIDMWEHAYMVGTYNIDKGAYVDAYLSALNWRVIANRFNTI